MAVVLAKLIPSMLGMTMESLSQRAERQQKLLVEWVDEGGFYECFHPFLFPDWQSTTVKVIASRLGWLKMEVTATWMTEDAWDDENILPSELQQTIWLDIQCEWDPEELDKAGSAHECDSLHVKVGDEMDFNTISLKEAEKFGVLIKSLVDFISDKLIDYCYDDLESDSKTLIGLIIQLPTSLRGQIKFACDTKLKELRASR